MTSYRPSSRRCGRSGSRCRRGPSATPAPGSRCSPEGVPRTVGEDRRRGPGAPVHRGGADGRAAHPVGPGRRLRRARRHAADQGVALGTINTNTFQDDDYKLGSVCHPDPRVRRKAIDHNLACIDVMDATGSRDLKIWLAGRHQLPRPGRHPRAPGPAGRGARRDLRPDRRGPAAGAGVQVLRAGVLHTDVPDWGTSYVQCVALGAEAWSSSTPATTRPAPTSSSSSRRCSGPASSAPSTSTAASTPTTT